MIVPYKATRHEEANWRETQGSSLNIIGGGTTPAELDKKFLVTENPLIQEG